MMWAFYVRSVPFTKGVISGAESLGGSESACVGLARALARRGHSVFIFAHTLAEDARGRDADGVMWSPAGDMHGAYWHWQWDVFVSLRMIEAFAQPPNARWRVLWNQDLLIDSPPGVAANIVATSWGIDTVAYVSHYHRRQWETQQEALRTMGWVTRNGYDPALVAEAIEGVDKSPHRVIHISRPERALTPLLRLWPALRERVPDAQLHLCRYSSMYDAEGWGRVCAAYDAEVRAVNAAVGGITYLGELGKPALYKAIAEAAVMWYPGVSTFAETSCIAAIEAQACGTPFVGSWRGALPETVPSGILVAGVAEDAQDTAYATDSVEAVADLLTGPQGPQTRYRGLQIAGRMHVNPEYTFDALAASWEAKALSVFNARWTERPQAIVRALLQYDDHTAAAAALDALGVEVGPEVTRCQRVIAGLEQGSDDYAAHATTNPVLEGDSDSRFAVGAVVLQNATHVLDVACGNGAMALKLAREYPHIRVTGLDYSPDLVRRATESAAALGMSDRVSFQALPVYDFETHRLTADAAAWMAAHAASFDGLWVGEFLEHCAGAEDLIDGLEVALADGAVCVYSMPHGPFMELLPAGVPVLRGHVHHWEVDDLVAVFGPKAGMTIRSIGYGLTPTGADVGTWVVSYHVDPSRPSAGTRDLAHRILTTRPRPTLSVGIIANDEALDIRRCLDSVKAIADEIVIGDSSTRTTFVRDTAAEFGATVLRIPSPTDRVACPDGFAGARNAVLDACTGDWFLWIDTDETLEGFVHLRKYLDAGPFLGYAINQNHLYVDFSPHADTPIRLFRRRPEVRFMGCVHEQPQVGDCNTDIVPAMILHDVQIAHIGYRSPDIRKRKSDRNLLLLKGNRERFPDRRLNGVFEIRELALRGMDLMQSGRNDDAAYLFRQAIVLFEQDYADPADKTGTLARPFYELALQHAEGAWEFEYAFAGTPGPMNGRHAQLKRVRARRYEDVERIVLHEVREAQTRMAGAPIPDTLPLVAADEPARLEVSA